MKKKLIALTILVALLIGSGTGWIANEYLGYKGLRLMGLLTTQHLRPKVAGGCISDEAKYLAFQEYSATKSLLAKLVSPNTAYAAFGELGCQMLGMRVSRNLIVNVGETALRDCFNNNSGTECTDVISTLKFHGLGEGTTAAAEANTGCETELTTEYDTDNTRATGSQATNGTNVYRTVGTNTVDEASAVTEWCLHTADTGAVPMWTRVVFAAVNLSPSDSLQTTYDLTIE